MKKVFSLVLALALVFSMSVCFAEEALTESNEEVMLISEEAEDVELINEEAPAEDGEITVKIDGKEVIFPDQKPILHNDRTMVPLRAIFEALGADVAWDNDTNTAMAKRGDIYILVQIDNTKLIKNNETIELDVPAMLLNDRTLVPVRAISEAFECKVDWVPETLEVLVTTAPAEEAEEAPAEEEKAEEATDEKAEETKEEAPAEEKVEEAADEKAEETEEEVPAEETVDEK